MPDSKNKSGLFSNLTDYILIILLVLLLCKLAKEHFLLDYCNHLSDLDSNEHPVQCKYKDPKEAANLLAFLNTSGLKLIAHLNNKYTGKTGDAAELAQTLAAKYRGVERLVETDPDNDENDTSYTLNKGYLVSMCLRASKDKNSDNFHNKNILLFVYLHELSHIASKVQDHPTRFWEVFKWLLKEAIESGVYEYTDYDRNPVMDYCGGAMDINYTPLNDRSLTDIS